MAEQNFDQFLKKLQDLNADVDEVGRRVVNRAVNDGMAVSEKNTPVGDYYFYKQLPGGKTKKTKEVFFMTTSGKQIHFKRKSVKQGGTLRKGWSLNPAKRMGSGWKGEYSNNVEYGLYVNFGHRIVVKGKTVGYVPGKFFLQEGTIYAMAHIDTYLHQELEKIRGNWRSD